MPVKIALPKGRLQEATAAMLQTAGWGIAAYHQKTRFYHLKSESVPNLYAKIFQEKDIPIQVAIGNYDLGICGLDWVQELMVKYPSLALAVVRDLGYGRGFLSVAANRSKGPATMAELSGRAEAVRIASEYPNLAEAFALKNRLKRFSVYPLWGAAEVYPPESADLALVARKMGEAVDHDLMPVSQVLDFSAVLIANKRSLETRDLSQLLAPLENVAFAERPDSTEPSPPPQTSAPVAPSTEDTIWLALPDGHQQAHTVKLLTGAGIQIEDYPSPTGNRRPKIHLDGVMVKVIRPQDMPLQVANGNFDLAITGRDWVRDHLYQFPSSPLTELLDLKLGRVKIVAVVAQTVPVSNAAELRRFAAERAAPIRVASEYVNIADKYARDNHLGRYRVIPTWGASEAFLPDDADLLIENTETGQTLTRHNLKIIDTLFESTACLIGHKGKVAAAGKRDRIKAIAAALRTAAEAL